MPKTPKPSPPRKPGKALQKPARPAKTPSKPASAAARAGRAAVPKVSPLRGVSADAYAAGLSPLQAEIVNALRALVMSAAPEAVEVVKWAQPVYELRGPFAYIKAFRTHVTLGFWRGAHLPDPAGLLEGDGIRMKHVKIATPASIPEDAIRAWVRAAAALNSAEGDPTKRGPAAR